jgi:hypothetical protein
MAAKSTKRHKNETALCFGIDSSFVIFGVLVAQKFRPQIAQKTSGQAANGSPSLRLLRLFAANPIPVRRRKAATQPGC